MKNLAIACTGLLASSIALAENLEGAATSYFVPQDRRRFVSKTENVSPRHRGSFLSRILYLSIRKRRRFRPQRPVERIDHRHSRASKEAT